MTRKRTPVAIVVAAFALVAVLGAAWMAFSGPHPAAGPQPDADAAQTRITVTVAVDSASAGSPVDESCTVTLAAGATVYDALAASGIGYNAQPGAQGIYVTSIGGLAEKENGSGSGWKYFVNGEYVPIACSMCTLADGDSVRWVYTVD